MMMIIIIPRRLTSIYIHTIGQNKVDKVPLSQCENSANK